MIKYYGKHSYKQSIHGKPIRFSDEVWSQNSPLGYFIAFEPRQGKTHKGVEFNFFQCSTVDRHIQQRENCSP